MAVDAAKSARTPSKVPGRRCVRPNHLSRGQDVLVCTRMAPVLSKPTIVPPSQCSSSPQPPPPDHGVLTATASVENDSARQNVSTTLVEGFNGLKSAETPSRASKTLAERSGRVFCTCMAPVLSKPTIIPPQPRPSCPYLLPWNITF